MARRHKDELRIGEIGRGLAGWALGLGLLRLHLAVFTVGAVALVLLRLYRTPDELSMSGPLRLWTVILACHVGALLAGWSTWRAVRPHRLPSVSPPPTGAAPLTISPPVVTRGVRPVNGVVPNGHAPLPVTAATEAAQSAVPAATPPNGTGPAMVPLPPRGRFSPRASEPPVVGHGGLPRPDLTAATAKLVAGANGALAAARGGWRRVAEATRAGVAAITARLTEPVPSPREAPVAADASSGPPPGWPAPPGPPVVPDVPRGWEGVITPADHQAGAADQPPAEPAGWPSPPAAAPVGPANAIGNVAAGSRPQPGAVSPAAADAPPVRAETEWTWMEAAAAAWLARREAEQGQPGAADPAPAASPTSGEAGESPSRP